MQVAANLEYSRKLLTRYELLYQQRVLDKNSLDKAKSDNDDNEQRLKQLDANIAEAKTRARENVIRAEVANVARNVAEVKASKWLWNKKKIYSQPMLE